mmetsp:Transcript_31651/g.67018  ORF Transcript_31651/g.67018 Transcript_31651/m.67018 type:complete len:587 (-) Transcript_31651:263-2023(-)
MTNTEPAACKKRSAEDNDAVIAAQEYPDELSAAEVEVEVEVEEAEAEAEIVRQNEDVSDAPKMKGFPSGHQNDDKRISDKIDDFIQGRLSAPSAKTRKRKINSNDGDKIAKPSSKTSQVFSDPFDRILNKTVCSCNQPGCRGVLKQYYEDATAPYPIDYKSQYRNNQRLTIRLPNPRSKNQDGRYRRRARASQQIYDRAAAALGVSNPETRANLVVAVHHFHRVVIEYFNKDPSREAKGFFHYFLSPDLVGNDENGTPRLGRELSSEDKLNCLDTSREKRDCKKAKKCICNLYLNVPFVTVDMAKANLGQKVMIHFLKEPEKKEKKEPIKVVDGVRVKLCKSCNIEKAPSEFSSHEWSKSPGNGECRQCGLILLKSVSTSTPVQVLTLQKDNLDLRQRAIVAEHHLGVAEKQRDAAMTREKMLETRLDEMRKKVATVQRKLRMANIKLEEQKEKERLYLLEQQKRRKEEEEERARNNAKGNKRRRGKKAPAGAKRKLPSKRKALAMEGQTVQNEDTEWQCHESEEVHNYDGRDEEEEQFKEDGKKEQEESNKGATIEQKQHPWESMAVWHTTPHPVCQQLQRNNPP